MFFQSKAQMTNEEREFLLKKTTKPITEDMVIRQRLDKLVDEKDISFKYDRDKINVILDEYNFPQNYSFFEDTNAEKKVKHQLGCGACWSFASTTALSYRFFKKGITVDLSPQEPLSCVIQNCDGNSPVSTQINLVKNGTVTDECMPYTAGNGIIEECSSSCKDGSEKIKYYAKNAYTLDPIYDDKHYYDYIKVIIDQLINYGPVVSSIRVYQDFMQEKFCPEVYSYDGISEYLGGHAIVIVGYGLYNNKYYWLIQNSWGDRCEKGLAKIEFGQIGIETVSFSEPDIRNSTESKEISINLESIVENTNCYINFTMDSDDGDLENNFEVIFKNNRNEDKLYYYCGIVPLMNKSSHICLLDLAHLGDFGNYELYDYSSLEKENKIKLINNKFTIDLSEHFTTILNSISQKQRFYISENGSKILFISYNCDECVLNRKIYPNIDSNPFEDCQQINFNNIESSNPFYSVKFYLVSCTIRENELGYFNYSYNNNNDPDKFYIFYYLCGLRLYLNAIIYKLDKTKYPLLRIKDLTLPNGENLDIQNSEFILTADVEGSISGFNSSNNLFFVFIDIENNNVKKTYELSCETNNIKIIRNYTIKCKFFSNNKNTTNYDSVTLYPYVHQFDTQPYEVIISKSITKKKNIKMILILILIPSLDLI